MIPFLGCSTLQGAGVSSLSYLLGCNRKADIRSSWVGKGSRGGCRTGAVNVFCSPPISGLESHRSSYWSRSLCSQILYSECKVVEILVIMLSSPLLKSTDELSFQLLLT